MIWEEVLRRRVRSRCGDPGEVFRPYGHRFGKWLDTGPDARPDRDVKEVRSAVAFYLAGAVREGRRLGRLIGAATGLAGALTAFLVIWIVT